MNSNKNKDMNKKAKFKQTPQGTLQKSHDKSWFEEIISSSMRARQEVDQEIILQAMKVSNYTYLVELVEKEDFEGIDNSN